PRLHFGPRAWRIRSWAASGSPGYRPSPFGSIVLSHSARITSSYFAHASASSANTAGIAGAFSSARTVHSTQILTFMTLLTAGQGRGGYVFRTGFIDLEAQQV